MLLSPAVHLALLLLGLTSPPALGLSFRRGRAWGAPLLFLGPLALGLSGGDALSDAAVRLGPAWAAGTRGWLFAGAGFLCFCGAELVSQRVMTVLGGGGARFTTRDDAAADG